MSNVTLITGPTGSGKTYRAIRDAKKLGKFVYIAPTGALCFDTYKQYQQDEVDSLSALGVVTKKGTGNHFTTYNLNFNFDDYDCIIIDECHWAFEFENHGYVVNRILKEFKKKIILVTGTINFQIPENWVVEKIVSNKNFKKEAVSYNVALELMRLGKPTLVLAQTKWEAEDFIEANLIEYIYNEYGGLLEIKEKFNFEYISSGCTPLKIYESCHKYNKGEIKILVGTNILAQGVNLACENLIALDSKSYSNKTLNSQKFGRLGRMNITEEDSVLTYHCQFKENEAPDIEHSFDLLPKNTPEDSEYQPPVMSDGDLKKFIGLIKKPCALIEKYKKGASSKVKMGAVFGGITL